MAFQLEKSGRLKKLTDEELAATEGPDDLIIVYSTGMSEGYPFWLYLAVKPSKYRKYMEIVSQKKEAITFTDHGEIIRYGYDETVPEDIRLEMEQKHGCSEHCLDNLVKELKKEQLAFVNKKEDTRINDIVAMLKKKQADKAT